MNTISAPRSTLHTLLALLSLAACHGAIGGDDPSDGSGGEDAWGWLGGGRGGADAAGGAPDGAGAGSGGASAAGGAASAGSGAASAGGGEASNGGSSGAGGAGPIVRQHLLLEADFEGADPFGAFANNQHCCAYSVTQSGAHARSGQSSFRAEVRNGDPAVSSGYRAEIEPNGVSDTGEKWYGFSLFFESPLAGSTWTGESGHFVQWHPDNSSGSASLGLWSYGEGWLVGLNPEGDSSAQFVGPGPAISAGVWHDVVIHADWGGSLIQVWIDGSQVVDRNDVDWASGPGQYLKLGINRWGGGPNGAPTSDDWVIYYDDFRIGDGQATFADVAP